MGPVTTGQAINVLDPDFYVDPDAAYRWLRDEAPVFWDPVQELWVISRYDDIVAVESNGVRYSSHSGSRPHTDQRADQSMINLDEPAHKAQRNLVAKRFTPRAVRSHEEQVRDVVTAILDDVVPLGECEAIEAIASRLPAIMIGDLLGYPREMWERVRYWSERIMAVIEMRKADPADDLISVWCHTNGWDTSHVLEEVILVLNGGAETTRTVIGSMIRELAIQPDQRRLLVERPQLLPTAVEEFIRWVSPILNMRRTATVDHEWNGEHIHAGDQLLLLYGSANRDPRVFDDPDALDVTRTHNRHVAFGFGTHFCLGAQLARLEINVMFDELLRRIPDWELVDPSEPKIMPATFARAYDRIRIRFTPS